MINIPGAIGFATFSLAIALAPGPSWVYVIASTARRGAGAGRAAVAGNATGILLHVIAAACGLSAILHYSAALYTIVKWAGSLYLMFLAIRIVRARSTPSSPPQHCDTKTFVAIYRDGVFVNVLNPKVSLLMLAILPQFVDLARGQVVLQIAILGTLHAMIASAVLLAVVAIVTRTAGAIKARPAVETTLRWTTGALLFGLGARMALAESA